MKHTSSVLSPNIFLGVLISDTCKLRDFLKIKDYVSQKQKIEVFNSVSVTGGPGGVRKRRDAVCVKDLASSAELRLW
jgi:hypothetical protein